MKWMDYKLSSSSQSSVLSQIGSHHSQNVEENREYLRKLIEAVYFLGKQNIPFRGHREDRSDLCNNSDQNRGNFLELISLLSKDNVTVNKKLSSDRKWLHNDIQNELIEIIASHTVTK